MNDQPIQKPLAAVSARFRSMADRIDHNSDASFGGSAVVCFPSGQQGGVVIAPIEMLILDGSQDPAMFLATLQTRLVTLLEELKDRERQLGMGRR